MVIGTLGVSGIACEAIVGILPQERLIPQPVRLGFSIWLDLEPAACTGNLSASVDYAVLTEELRGLVVASQFELLETLVYTLARYVLKKYSLVQTVEISCAKPAAIPGSEGPVATIRMARD